MAVLRSDTPQPAGRKRLLLLFGLAAIALAVLVWQRQATPRTTGQAARLAAANRQVQTGDPAAAVAELRSLIVADPGSADLYAALGGAYLAQERYDLAVQPLELAASLAPDTAHIQCRLADAYLHLRERDAAVRSIQASLKREPDCPRARLVAGEQWLRDDDLTRALAEFREAARLAPSSPLGYQRAGYILLELDRAGEAEKMLLDGLRAGPEDIGIHVQLGRLYSLRISDPAALIKAESHYLRALQGNPNAAVVKASLGEIARQAGRPRDARRWWEEALEEDPDEAKALYGLGQMLLAEGKKTEGQALLKRYTAAQQFQRQVTDLRMQTATRPTRELRLRFARLALLHNQVAEVERQLSALLRDYPADPVVRHLQGDLYMLQQRAEDAEREYALASALPPEPAR